MPKCQTDHFNFWGALGVTVHGPAGHPYLQGYRKKFAHYLTSTALPGPSLTFEVCPFTLDEKDARIFNRYRIKPNQIGRTHHYKIAKWQSQFRGIEGLDWHVNLWGNRASGVMVPHLTMTSLTQLALAQRGWIPVHAAALRNPPGDRGVVLAGRRGVGKTTVSGRLLKQGWRLISEDRIYLQNNVIQGLRTPVNMKYDRQDPQIVRLPRATRLRLKRNHLLAITTAGYIRLHEPVPLTQLIPNQLEDHGPFTRLIYLQSGGDTLTTQANPPAQDLALQMIRGNEFEDQALIEDMLAYQYCFPKIAEKTGYLWEDDQRRLTAAIQRDDLDRIKITTPLRPTDAQWDQIVQEVIG